MYKDKYTRLVQTSVTVFLYCGDEYLFLKRGKHKRIDPGIVNGIGGKLEPKENFLQAAVRETKEETGYDISDSEFQLTTIGKLEGGYEEDWVMCFFKAQVSHKNIPAGNTIEEGEFVWIHKDKVKDTPNLIDDLHYVFDDIVKGNITFFTAQINNNEKINTIETSIINK